MIEPSSTFGLVVINDKTEVKWETADRNFLSGFHSNAARTEDGRTAHLIVISPIGVPLTHDFPVRLRLTKQADAEINLLEVLHKKAERRWVPVPPEAQPV